MSLVTKSDPSLPFPREQGGEVPAKGRGQGSLIYSSSYRMSHVAGVTAANQLSSQGSIWLAVWSPLGLGRPPLVAGCLVLPGWLHLASWVGRSCLAIQRSTHGQLNGQLKHF